MSDIDPKKIVLDDINPDKIIIDKNFKFEKPLTMREKLEGALPSFGQFSGGVTGGLMFPATPFRASAIGGTLGRGLGRVEQIAQKTEREQPFLKPFMSGFPGARQLVAGASEGLKRPETFGKFGGELATTAGIESLTGGLGSGITGLARGAMRGVIGTRVADLGMEKGWKNILSWLDRADKAVPVPIKEKLGSFFKNLSNKAGGEIDNLITQKYNKIFIPLKEINIKIKNILPKGTTINDLDASGIQKKRMMEVTNKLLSQKGGARWLREIWDIRKELDNLIYEHTWTKEAFDDYLMPLRRILNEPMTKIPDIAKAFGKYSAIIDAKDTLGKKFVVHKGLEAGELYSPEIERTATGLLKTGGDEIMAWLARLDKELGTGNKVMGDFFNYAASESLEGDVGWSYITKIILGSLGGKKIFPQIGGVIQSKGVQFPAKAFGRFIPTATTELLTEENQ